MSSSQPGPKCLPDRPSEENLKKQAKRRAKRDDVALSMAQYKLAREYGFASWAKLIAHVRDAGAKGKGPVSDRKSIAEIVEAAASADV